MSTDPRPTPHASSELLQAVYEQSPFSIVLYDADGRGLHANAAFTRLFGLTFADVPPGYTVLEDPELDRQGFLPLVRRAFAGEAVVLPRVRYDTAGVHGKGRETWTQGHFYPVLDARGVVRNVVLVHMDLSAQVEAEGALRRAEERWRFLAEVSERLHASLDVRETLAALARQAVPALADWCAVDVLGDGGTVERAAVVHADPAKVALERELEARYPISLDAPAGVGRVLRTGERVVQAADDETLVAIARDPEHLRLMRALGMRAVLTVPLTARGGVFGALSLVQSESGRGFDDAAVALAEELARRAGAAVENARLFQRVEEAREQLEQQATELEIQSEQLQEQTEALAAEQRRVVARMEAERELNDELQRANAELADAYRIADASRETAEDAGRFVRSVLESISDPFVVQDAEWRFRFVNEAAAARFGRLGTGTPDALLGRVMWEVFPGLEGTRFWTEMHRAMLEGVPVAFEEFYARTGTWTEVRSYPLPDGGLATSWRDVTERRRVEESRHYLTRASEILGASLDYERTLASLTELVVPQLADWASIQMLDDAGRLEQLAVAHVDPAKVAWARELNARYPVDADAPAGATAVARTGQPELYAEITDAVLVAGARDAEHLRIMREIGFTSALIVPLVARERPLGVMSLVSAESGRRYGPAELELAMELAARAASAVENARLHRDALEARAVAERAAAEAAEANRAKADFLARMSHELRTPLNAIGGYTQLIELGIHGTISDAQRQALARIQRSQLHLLGLINDVLNYAKLEAGRVEYDVRPVAAAPLLEELEGLVGPLLAAKQLRYEHTPASPALAAMADRERAQQILLNLLSNAIKFTPAAGTVRVGAALAGAEVHFVVEDTGIGIAPERLATVFEPFVQVGRAVAGQEGTGLGLSISRDLAHGMGGDLRVRSTVGAGSTFTLVLPHAPIDNTA